MAKHKAPTEVTIVPTVERAGFGLFVEKYWKPAAGLGILIAGSVLALQYVKSQEDVAQSESWDALNAVMFEQYVARGPENYTAYTVRVGEPEELKSLAETHPGSPAAPWALASLAFSYARESDFAAARGALDELRSQHPSNFLAEQRFRFGDDATPRTLVEQTARNMADWSEWKAAHAKLYDNPELPPDAPKVRIRTDQGAILVGLYTEQAPKHAENFLERCREGYYDGLLFHRVVAGFMIQGGDPNTRSGDPSTWGQGGPDEGVPAEKNELRHFAGVLAAAKSDPNGDSSGSQFYLTVAPAHGLDANYTVFGKVLEGIDLAVSISESEIAEGTQDRPAHPVRIQGTDVL